MSERSHFFQNRPFQLLARCIRRGRSPVSTSPQTLAPHALDAPLCAAEHSHRTRRTRKWLFQLPARCL